MMKSEIHRYAVLALLSVAVAETGYADNAETRLFMDVHRLGAGKVTPEDVAAAHEQDLATQGKHGVHFINYWVDPRTGDIFCLSEAESADAVIATHRDAHGLVSDEIAEVT